METNHIAIVLSALTLLVLIVEKTFGGGNRLATKFAELDKVTTAAIAQLRIDLTQRVDTYEDNYSVGINAIQANIHALQIGLLEFRAKMAEEYMHKSDYNAGISDIKRDVHDGFEKIEKRFDRIEDNMKNGS